MLLSELIHPIVNLICVWPCIMNVGKVIKKNQLDATKTIYWSPRSAQHVSGHLWPIFTSVRLRYTAYIIVSCCGRQGFGEWQRDTRCSVWRKLLDSVKQRPSYRTRSATLPLSEPLPTTTTGHYIICCISQSYAPEDGQKIAQNMLSWSGRSTNCYCCI